MRLITKSLAGDFLSAENSPVWDFSTAVRVNRLQCNLEEVI